MPFSVMKETKGNLLNEQSGVYLLNYIEENVFEHKVKVVKSTSIIHYLDVKGIGS